MFLDFNKNIRIHLFQKRKMINNKVVTISKTNQFQDGWTLFESFKFELLKNYSFKDIKINDIVRAITYSTTVNIILSNSCLPSNVIKELEWANKYISINLIVKNKDIVKEYPKLNFTNIIVDSNVNFNYIGINGKENLRIIISDLFTQVDETIENLYFNNVVKGSNYEFLKTARVIFLADRFGNKNYDCLIEEAKTYNCKIYYLVEPKYYTKQLYEKISKLNIDILVSDFVGENVVYVDYDNRIFELSYIRNDANITFQIPDFYNSFGDLFKCCLFDDVISCDKINNKFCILKGKIVKLHIQEKKVIENEIFIESMSDFLDEKFDNSICENHNSYSTQSKNVEYIFTLIPPLIDNSYSESHLYDEIHKLEKEWKKIQVLNISEIKSRYNLILNNEYGLINVLNCSESFYKEFNNMVKNVKYSNFYSLIRTTKKTFLDFKNSLFDILSCMFNEIDGSSSITRFDKFDNEIEGYRQTIIEKTALIEKGIEVLSNKRRVEILNKKINDLLELKKKFESNSGTVTNKKKMQFLDRCREILDQHLNINQNTESIENIVKTKEASKETLLENFVTNYLFNIFNFVEKGIKLLEHLEIIEIPEHYSVYEKNSQKFIVIENETEFFETKELCNKFDLLCLTRR